MTRSSPAVQKKLHQASDTIEKAQVPIHVIGRKPRNVQQLPASEAAPFLPDSELEGEIDLADAELPRGARGGCVEPRNEFSTV
jgi:DNA recombination protein RmuC